MVPRKIVPSGIKLSLISLQVFRPQTNRGCGFDEMFTLLLRGTNPFRTAVPFWGQTTQISTSLPPKRDCGPKRVKGVSTLPPSVRYMAIIALL